MFALIFRLLFLVAFLFALQFLSLRVIFKKHVLLITSITTLLFFSGYIFEQQFGTRLTSILFQLSAAWLEAMALLFFLVLLYHLKRIIIRRTRYKSLFDQYAKKVVLYSWLALILLGFIQAQVWQTTFLEFSDERLTEDVRIVQVTDVHAFGANAPNWYSQVIDRAMTHNPDIILLTGDIVDYPSDLSRNVFDKVVPVPILYVLGNHEFYLGEEQVLEGLKTSEVILLREESIEYFGVQFIGIDDSDDEGQVARYIDGLIDNESYTVLLYHRPLGMQDAANAGVDVMLSGHTHGGQSFPFHIPVWLINGKFTKGLEQIDNMHLYVSKGSGTKNWPLRLLSSQEIVVIDLIATS